MTHTAISLGFAVPAGTPVEIPLRHMAVCGQTQEAGKTTALEALITRAGVRALTFITKRGEASFTSSRRIDPYFREQADWQFVASILEASRGEKLKFERAWIIRASKGARTLADVQRNVRKAMETAKGLAGDVYLTLDAYLEVVVPAIARVRWAPRVELGVGVNAMDLTGLTLELQHLVIKSSLDWVLEHDADVVVVVPEAWKFIPQGRGTPVKLSAAAFIRQGAGLKNYLWLDSQDLGGIEKEILRSVPVWILGVQREANEIKRTLENIPAGIAKPSKADIATLELGQFFACWGKHAIRTYAQPAWMNAAQAQQVATGALTVELATKLSAVPRPMTSLRAIAAALTGPPLDMRALGDHELYAKEETVTKDEAARLTRENAELKTQLDLYKRDYTALQRRLDELEKGQHANQQTRPPPGRHRTEPDAARSQVQETDRVEGLRDRATASAAAAGTNGHVDEAVYQAIKARLIDELPRDPRVIEVVVSRPELQVKVKRQVLTADGSTWLGMMGVLIQEGFFDKPVTSSGAHAEASRRGLSGIPARAYEALEKLNSLGFVTNEGKGVGYQVVAGMKVHVVEAA